MAVRVGSAWRRVGGLVLLGLLVMTAGCRDPRTFLRVTVRSGERADIKSLAVTVLIGSAGSDPATVSVPTAGDPIVFALEFDSQHHGAATVEVDATLAGGAVRHGKGDTEVVTGETRDVEVILPGGAQPDGGSDGGGDAGGGPGCGDGVLNLGESDVDCGGAHCEPCALGRSCGRDRDCKSSLCDRGKCVGFDPVGPWGMGVTALAIDPGDSNIVYAASEEGLYGTRDGGARWRRLTLPLQGAEPVWGVAVNPADPTQVYARTDRRLLVSTDRGDSWTPSPVDVKTFNPDYPPAVPVAVSAGGGSSTVFIGSDDGVTISRSDILNTVALVGRRVLSLAVQPDNPMHVVAGTRSGGVFESTDGGRRWDHVGPPGGPLDGVLVLGLALTPGMDPTLYAASTGGLFRWTSAGGWQQEQHSSLNRWPPSVALVPEDPTQVVAAVQENGVVRRDKGGWSRFADGLENVPNTLVVALAPGGVMYAGTAMGVYRGTLGNRAKWQPALRGLDGWRIESAAWGPSGTSALYTVVKPRGYDPMLYRSSDAGGSWQRVAVPQTITTPTAVATGGRGNSSTLYLAGRTIEGTAVVAISDDGGATWASPLSEVTPLVRDYLDPLVVDPSDPKIVLASDDSGSGNSDGIYRSTDGGRSWAAWDTGLPPSQGGPRPHCAMVSVVFDDKGTAYAAGPCSVYRRSVGSATWTLIEGNSKDKLGNTSIHGLSYSLANGKLYAATDNGTFVGTNVAGLVPTWERLAEVSNGESLVWTVLAHASDPNVLWAGNNYSVAWSVTGGMSTSSWPAQQMDVEVRVLASQPGSPLTVVAGTAGRGLWKTTTGGF